MRSKSPAVVFVLCALLVCAVLLFVSDRQAGTGGTAVASPTAVVATGDAFMASRAPSIVLAPLRGGQAVAAAGEFRKLKICLLASQAPGFLAERARSAALQGNRPKVKDTPELAAMRQAELDTLDRMQAAVGAAPSLCPGTEAAIRDGGIYDAALAAARAGDATAASCYVALAYPMPEQMRADTARAEAWRRNARTLISDGIARGDWRMVALAREARDARASDWLARVAEDDAAEAYALLRLESLGAGEPDLKRRLTYLSDMERAHLDSGRAEAADRWARETFARSFLQSGPMTEAMALCD